MPPVSIITTLKHAAQLLNAPESVISDIHSAMGSRRGAVLIADGTEDCDCGFTEYGMRELKEWLDADTDSPPPNC